MKSEKSNGDRVINVPPVKSVSVVRNAECHDDSLLNLKLSALTEALKMAYDGLVDAHGIGIAPRLRSHTFYAMRALNNRSNG